MEAKVIVWNHREQFGFFRTLTGKTFYARNNSFCDFRQAESIVVGARVEFERQPRDKSFDDALNAGLFRDDPRIVNHRNPRIVDKTKRPTAINVRLSSVEVAIEPEPEAETVLAPATRNKPLIQLIMEKRGKL